MLESGEANIIHKYISDGQIIFDVGAHVGDWTKEASKAASGLEIHLFEPNPSAYQELLKNLNYIPNQNKLIPQNLGLSCREGTKVFYHYKSLPVLSTLYRRVAVEQQGLESPEVFTILNTTLDQYCKRQKIRRINYLKIDVEGAELDVLLGAEALLKAGRIDYIQFEYGGTYLDANITLKQVFEYLKQFKYSIFKIKRNQLEYISEFSSNYENFELSNFLAINERFQRHSYQEQNLMLNLKKLCQQYDVVPRGVIHIGAHEGNEINSYQAMGVKKVLYVEANPAVFERLKQNVDKFDNVQVANYAIANENGTINLRVTSFDQSSSILPLKHHQDIYPNIVETHQVVVESRTLDTLISELKLNPGDYNVLNIDIQGAELLALQGAKNWLQYVDAINTEVNYKELYEGCALIDELDEFLEEYGFERVSTITPHHSDWGDAFYVKKPAITASLLGNNNFGRFGNQIFQYAFLKLYAFDNNLRVETPAWDGQYLFGHNDPFSSHKLPLVHEQEQPYSLSESAILNAKTPLKNVDFKGYFQFHTQYHARHKDYFCSLFRPVSTIETLLQEAVQRLRSKGKTVVGLHLRRGDYQVVNKVVPYLTVAPNQWYQEWLKGLWETLDEPVLFIASDELDMAIGDFSDYNPVTIRDLGIDLPRAPYYPDFYILSQCDVLAISNSTFSFAASMLNERCKFFSRPHLQKKKLIPFDPWNSEPLLRDIPDASLTYEFESSGKIEIQEMVKYASDAILDHNIDSLVPTYKALSNKICIGGWVIGKQSTAIKVNLICNQEVILEIPVGLHRPDVAKVFSDISNATNSGYSITFNIQNNLLNSDLHLEAVLENQTRVILGKLRFRFALSESDKSKYFDAFNSKGDKCQLSICAIMKNEAPYLIEWLEFHKLVGVERFYLYNNNSTDNTFDVLQPYVRSGEVVLHDWPFVPGQISAYEHCLSHYSDDAEWMAFIDLDEFLFPTKQDNLKDVLKEFDEAAAVGVNMLYFGSSYHEHKPEGLQIENYTRRSNDECEESHYIKSIVRPKQILRPDCPHFFVTNDSQKNVVTENKETLKGSISNKVSINKLRINHYYTRSRQEMKEKLIRGDAIFVQKNWNVIQSRDRNELEDLTIHRFIPNLKKAMQFKEPTMHPTKNFIDQFLTNNDLVFYVGANIGQKIDFYLSKKAKIICFEPQPNCISILNKKYQNHPNVTIVNKGLAEKPGKMHLSICSDNNVLSTFSDHWKTGRFSHVNWDGSILVEVATLDQMIQQWGKPHFCIIDVEGFEYQVLKGLSQSIPYLCFEFTAEFLDEAKSCVRYLTQLGYEQFNFAIGESQKLTLDDWVDEEKLISEIIQYNDSLLWGDIYARFS